MRRVMLGLVLALLAGLGWRQMSGGGGVPVEAAAAIRVPALPIPAPNPEAGVAKPVAVAAHAKPRRVDLAYRHGLVRDYTDTDNRMEFVRQLLPKARAGDADAMVLIAEALRTCTQVKNRAEAAGQSSEDVAETQASLRLCGGLENAPGEEVGSAAQWLTQAAEQGNGVALLMLARSAETSGGTEQRLADLHAAIATADPTVVGSMILMATAKASAAGKGVSIRTEMAEVDLVLCELGYDCSAAGPVYANLNCQHKGCLHADGVERYYELSMNPDDFAEAQAYVRRLAADLRSGRYDWPEAQVLEQEVRGAAEDGGTNQASETGKSP